MPQDDAEEVTWYRMAAEQGHDYAQSNLGVFYAMGKGVPQSYVSAYMWFSLAVAQGYEKAEQLRDIAASQMTSDEIAEAQRMAREWIAKHRR